MLGNTENDDLLYELDPFGYGFPVDEYAARTLVERYPIENAVAVEIADRSETVADVEDAQAEDNEITEERIQHIATLRNALSDIGINLEAELRNAGIDPEAEGGVEAFTTFLE